MEEFGAAVLVVIAGGLVVAAATYVFRRTEASLDRWHARSSSREAAELEADLARIADTRDFWLDLVALLQKAARNDWAAAERVLRDGLEASRYPHAEPGLTSDPELVTAMTTTIPEVFEHLGNVPRDLADRLDLVTNVISGGGARGALRTPALDRGFAWRMVESSSTGEYCPGDGGRYHAPARSRSRSLGFSGLRP